MAEDSHRILMDRKKKTDIIALSVTCFFETNIDYTGLQKKSQDSIFNIQLASLLLITNMNANFSHRLRKFMTNV